MIKHKVLYVPEGKYLYFSGLRENGNGAGYDKTDLLTSCLEEAYFRCSPNEGRNAANIKDIVKAILVWQELYNSDDFFILNKIPNQKNIPLDFEIIEVEVEK